MESALAVERRRKLRRPRKPGKRSSVASKGTIHCVLPGAGQGAGSGFGSGLGAGFGSGFGSGLGSLGEARGSGVSGWE